MFSVFINLSAIDPALGRLDPFSLSDQALMEMAVEKVDDRSKRFFRDRKGAYLDFSTWEQVECDAAGKVQKFVLTNFDGEFGLAYLPTSMGTLMLTGKKATATLEAHTLPKSLQCLFLESLELKGSLDTIQLPPSLVNLHILKTGLTGRTDLTTLPCKIMYMYHHVSCMYVCL